MKRCNLNIEYRDGKVDSFRLRIYITVLHEVIRSGGSIVLQIYSIIEGYEVRNWVIIASLWVNGILFLKSKIMILLWCQSLSDLGNIPRGRKFMQYIIVIFEIVWIAVTFLAILRSSKITALIVYAWVFLLNMFYTTALMRTDLVGDDEIIMNYCVTMNDYLCLISIRVFMVRKITYFCLEVFQILKIFGIIGVLAAIYVIDERPEAIVAICCDSVLALFLIIYACISCRDPLTNDIIDDESIRNEVSSQDKIKQDHSETQFKATEMKTQAQ